MAATPYKARNFRYQLQIDNINRAGFSEVTMGDNTVDVIDYREGNGPEHTLKYSGLTKWGPITMKGGVTTGANAMELFKWFSDVSTGHIEENRRNIVISVLDEAGKDEVARFVIADAWPTKYHPSDLNGKGNDILLEIMEFVHHGFERVL